MSNTKESSEILNPINQKKLHAYKNIFKDFVNLFNKNKLPNSILLTGEKGLGKATFVYHFINFLLSIDEDNSYELNNFSINSNNKSFINVNNGTHPNFFLLDSNFLDENIKIENVRNLLVFLRKSTFHKNLKIVLIDNAEYLNVNSSNALLKSIEEPEKNTFFFIIQNSSSKIIETIKSRCVEFKFFLNIVEKKDVMKNLISQFNLDYDYNSISEKLYYNSPGNILNFLNIINEIKDSSLEDLTTCILKSIDIYKKKKDPTTLNFIYYLVELHYYELSLKNNKFLSIYSFNKKRILSCLNDIKKFHLDRNSSFIQIKNIITNES
jgi:DNA polymerase III subunit delta'